MYKDESYIAKKNGKIYKNHKKWHIYEKTLWT